jgi:ParB family transcriptional regulator, chromosome partitioning protein
MVAKLKAKVEKSHDIFKGKTQARNWSIDEPPRYQAIPINLISPDPNQPRQDFGDIEELKTSIKEHGIVQPLIVSANDPKENSFTIIAGERRFRAATELGLEEVPAIIRTVEEHKRLEVQLVENLQREELKPLEESNAYKALIDQYAYTQEELGKKVGKSPYYISRSLSLLNLPDVIKNELAMSQDISKSLLNEILNAPNENNQIALWEQAKTGNLTVAKARKAKNPKNNNPGGRPKHAKKVFQISNGTVTIQLKQTKIAKDDISQALSEAVQLNDNEVLNIFEK